MSEIDQNENVNRQIIGPQARLAKRQGKQITNNTATWRSGSGKSYSPIEAKENLSRNTFIRPGEHQGGLARGPEHRVMMKQRGTAPTPKEIKNAINENPDAVRGYRMDNNRRRSDEEVYQLLKDEGLA